MSGLITLREFAKQHKIKKPTVNARLKKLEKLNSNKELSIKSDNTIYLTDIGRELLEKSFKDSPVKTTDSVKQKTFNESINNDYLEECQRESKLLYKKQIKRLEDDLKVAQYENEKLLMLIDQLIATNEKLSSSISAALVDSQRLIGQEQSLALIDKTKSSKNKTKEKKRILSRLVIAGRILKGDYD